MQKDSRELQATVRAAQAGDESAFERLLDEVERPVYRLLLGMLRSREDAEDAAQETLVKLWRTLPSYRFECPILPYALQIARRTALDTLRRKRSEWQQTLPLTVEGEDGEAHAADIPDPDEYADPSRAYERAERIAEVRRAIDELPSDFREILLLKDMEGLAYEQIGHVLALEEGTVKSRLFRARKKLAEILKTRNIF